MRPPRPLASASCFILAIMSLADLIRDPKYGHVLADSPQARDSNSTQDLNKIEWWKKTNFYHIYLRSFRDSTGDGNGDLRGVIEKLDYLHQIGVETILMAPFYSSPMKDCGYDIDDYLAINPMFGSMEDYDELLRELRKRNMRIVVDFVPNHSSDKHYWFQCSERALLEPERCGKYKDYYIWSDSKRFEGKYPSNWVSVFGGGPAWTWSEVRKQFYLHQFLPQQPDLNFHNPAVRGEFVEIARFWLRKSDGLRVDSAIFLIEEDQTFADEPPNGEWKEGDDPAERLLHVHTRCLHESAEIVEDWRRVAQEAEFAGQQKVIITEAYDRVAKLVEYYGSSWENRYADLPFNFELFKLNSDNLGDARYLREVLLNWIGPTRALAWPDEHGAMSPWIIWVTGNHDNKRLANRVGRENVALFKWLAYVAPGVPVNYYGDELPLHDANFNSIPQRTIDEGEPTRLPFRAPMAWSDERPSGGFSASADIWMPLNADYQLNNVQRLMSDQSEAKNQLKLFVKLQQFRKHKLNTFTFGDLVFFNNGPQSASGARQEILALARTHDKFPNVMLLANLNKERPLVVRLRSSARPTELFGRHEGGVEPPKKALVELANYVDTELAPGVADGGVVELEGLVLGPSQCLLLTY